MRKSICAVMLSLVVNAALADAMPEDPNVSTTRLEGKESMIIFDAMKGPLWKDKYGFVTKYYHATSGLSQVACTERTMPNNLEASCIISYSKDGKTKVPKYMPRP